MPLNSRTYHVEDGRNWVTLHWIRPTGVVDGYEISRLQNSRSEREYTFLARIENPDSTSYEDHTVVESSDYVYRVRAYNSAGTGPASELKCGILDAVIAQGSRGLAAPDNSAASLTENGNGVLLTWTEPTRGYHGQEVPPATAYQILRWDVRRGYANWDVLVDDTGSMSTSYVDRDITPNNEYDYQVRAWNDWGVGERSFSAVVRTGDLDVIGAPRSFGVSSSPEGAVLTWEAPEDAASTEVSYRIYRRDHSGATVPLVLLASDVRDTSYIDGTVVAGSEYHYQVRVDGTPLGTQHGIPTKIRYGFYRAPSDLAPIMSVPQTDGIPQVGNTLEVSFADPPSGAFAYQWLRGSEVIAGATASTYVLAVADVGARLSVRVESGGESRTIAATATVWPAPANPPLAAGEEELLSATVTLGSHQFPFWVAGYGRVLGESFGEMDVTSFEDGGATYVIDAFLVNSRGVFGLATGSTLPAASGLVAYWNGYRISGLEAEPVKRGELPMLVGRTPQPSTEYSRYEDGASDGVRVAVSLRRVRAAAQKALTAAFQGLPEAHDGESAFRFRVAFSEDIGISFRSLREDAFTVTGGRVTKGRRVDDRRDLFEMTVEPDGDGDVTITLPAGRACGVSGAICTKGENRRKLTNTPTASVAGPEAASGRAALTAHFVGVPAEHDGESAFTFELRFSEHVAGLSYKTLRDSAFTVTNGRVTGARRLARSGADKNRRWEMRVEPTSFRDIAVSLPATADCAATGALCTADGRQLANTPSATVLGPATPRHLTGSADDDTLTGRDGNDVLTGGLGADALSGGGGHDTLVGDDGDATVNSADEGNDLLYGGSGDDLLYGDGGNDLLYGDGGNDLLYGGRGDDLLFGYGGDDALYGNEGNDTLDGGAGADTLTGGTDADTFVFAAGHGADTITDFFPEEADQIDLSAFAGLGGFESLTLAADGTATVLDLSAHGGGTVRLSGIAAADLLAADFLWP